MKRFAQSTTTLTPYWWRQFYRKHPLTERCARSVAETEDDTHSWLEGPDAEIDRPTAADRLIDRVCWLIAFALFVGMISAPRWWPH